MKLSIRKPLASYSAAAIYFSSVSEPADAQIIYTDINPDTVLISEYGSVGNTYPIDLNNDGITDFNIRYGYASGWYAFYDLFITYGNRVAAFVQGVFPLL